MRLFDFLSKNRAQNDLEPLKHRVSDLDSRLEAVERRAKQMGLEWEDTYDRVAKAMRRLNKRDRDKAKADDAPGTTLDIEPGVTPAGDLRSRVLRRRRHA